jgi:hypothetical protein
MSNPIKPVQRTYCIIRDARGERTVYTHTVVINGETLVANLEIKYNELSIPSPTYIERQLRDMLRREITDQLYPEGGY